MAHPASSPAKTASVTPFASILVFAAAVILKSFGGVGNVGQRANIVRLQLARIERRIADNHGITMTIDETVVVHIVDRCTEIASGGRMIDAILTNTMLPDMSVALLEKRMRGEEVAAIRVTATNDGFSYDYQAVADPGKTID